MTDEKRLVIPGEVIAKGNDYLPGEWTEKRGDEIVAIRYGLFEETDKLVKVIPISGTYQPRRGNVVIGKVENVLMNGWFIDIGTPENSFLPVSEVPRYVNRGELESVLDIGDMVIAKILNLSKKGIDLTIKSRGLERIDDGMILEINSNRVPRVIGREGSMVNLIKKETGCEIVVGQNGVIWIKGNNIDDELKAKKAVLFVADNIFAHGLTEEVEKMFAKEKKNE